MPNQILMTMPILHENIPVGTDFVGGAKPLAPQPAGPADMTPGSDFAGGAVPLTSETQQGETD